MLKIRYFRDLGVTTKFILWFLLVALVPLTIATYISYGHSRVALEEEVTKSLYAISDNKANLIKTYLTEKEKSATALSYMSEVIDITEEFTAAFYRYGPDSTEYTAVDARFRPFLTYYQRSFGYDAIYLVDPDGNILFSTAGSKGNRSLYEMALYGDSGMHGIFVKAKNARRTEISKFTYYPDTGESEAFIAAPVLKGADMVGMVIVRMTNEGLTELVRDYTGLGLTGEIVLVEKVGGETVAITPLRFDPDAAFKRVINVSVSESTDTEPVTRVRSEQMKAHMYTDYRGKQVLAVWQYLESFRIGLIVKMDISEIMASADELRNTLFRISFMLLIAVTGAAVLIANSVATPIKQLTGVSSTIANGDLSVRAEVDSRDEVGELAGSFNRMTDSLVEAKDKVERQKSLLEEANKELDSFVYTVSHDLRAPLRGITAFAGFLSQDYGERLDKEGKDYIGRIRKGADKMQELIDDLLTLSRISRIKNPYEEVDMRKLIDDVVDRISYDIKELNVRLDVPQVLPVIKCDRIKMAEVFLNLINNAIKFSSKKKDVRPHVEIGYNKKNRMHEFYVKDNGIGIPRQHQKDIFGIFKRLHKRDEYEGTGAGLSIVKRVIDDHKGEVWVRSEEGKGSTFFFTIPMDIKNIAGYDSGRQV